jgi:hypothetical protein
MKKTDGNQETSWIDATPRSNYFLAAGNDSEIALQQHISMTVEEYESLKRRLAELRGLRPADNPMKRAETLCNSSGDASTTAIESADIQGLRKLKEELPDMWFTNFLVEVLERISQAPDYAASCPAVIAADFVRAYTAGREEIDRTTTILRAAHSDRPEIDVPVMPELILIDREITDARTLAGLNALREHCTLAPKE